LIDHRVNRRDFSSENLISECVELHLNLQTDFKLGKVMLRQSEVGINRIESLERHDWIPFLQILAQIDLPDPDHPVKRRANRFPRDQCGILINSGLCLAITCFSVVVIGLLA
jgi:hypothetical protein